MLLRTLLTFALALAAPGVPLHSQSSAPNYPRLLRPVETTSLLPASVFFKGQSAAIQARNSGGLEFEKGRFFLVTLVDTSGYSSSVQERYQAYLITEFPLSIDGHRLSPGAYGCGFLPGDRFLVMDIGGHDLFTAHTQKDPSLKRPSPLQLLPGTVSATYRLFAGRTFVEVTPQL